MMWSVEVGPEVVLFYNVGRVRGPEELEKGCKVLEVTLGFHSFSRIGVCGLWWGSKYFKGGQNG